MGALFNGYGISFWEDRYFGLYGISYLSCQLAHHTPNQTASNRQQEEVLGCQKTHDIAKLCHDFSDHSVEREMGHGQADRRGVSVASYLLDDGFHG